MTEEEKRNQAHNWHNADVEAYWYNLQRWFCDFKSQFDYIHVDFKGAFCNGGCCRPIKKCVNAWIAEILPRTLDVTGLLAGEEEEFEFESRARAKHHISGLEDLKRHCDLHFLAKGQKLRWDTGKLLVK